MVTEILRLKRWQKFQRGERKPLSSPLGKARKGEENLSPPKTLEAIVFST
jgi:hypothetical protein